jgi:hypothetical protein
MSIGQYLDPEARRDYMRKYLVGWRAAHPGKSTEYNRHRLHKQGELGRDKQLAQEEAEMRAILEGEE